MKSEQALRQELEQLNKQKRQLQQELNRMEQEAKKKAKEEEKARQEYLQNQIETYRDDLTRFDIRMEMRRQEVILYFPNSYCHASITIDERACQILERLMTHYNLVTQIQQHFPTYNFSLSDIVKRIRLQGEVEDEYMGINFILDGNKVIGEVFSNIDGEEFQQSVGPNLTLNVYTEGYESLTVALDYQLETTVDQLIPALVDAFDTIKTYAKTFKVNS